MSLFEPLPNTDITFETREAVSPEAVRDELAAEFDHLIDPSNHPEPTPGPVRHRSK